MSLIDGEGKGGTRVWRLSEGGIVLPFVTIDGDGSFVGVATEEKQDVIIANQTNGTQQTKITDGTNVATITSQGIQRVTNDNFPLSLNTFGANLDGHSSTLSVAATTGDTSLFIQAADFASFSVDETILIAEGPTRETDFPIITAKNGTTELEINRPLDFGYSQGVTIQHAEINFAQNGTKASPVVFRISPPPGLTYHIKGAIFSIIYTGLQGDFSTFGNIAGGLTNGLVIRSNIGGVVRTRSSIRDNRDFNDDDSGNLVFIDKGGPGLLGMTVIYLFNDFGAHIELNGTLGEYVEMLVQDDLTDLENARVKAHGYITVN
jgi:hypothetical protein